MTDKELLEAAARAAGMEARWEQPRGAATGILRARFPGDGDAFPWWNPLEDDAQALRLAVKRQMDIFVRAEWVEAVAPMGPPVKVRYAAMTREEATRRAIVRAAAMAGDA